MICKKCGKEIQDGIEVCPFCGSNLKEETVPVSPTTQPQPDVVDATTIVRDVEKPIITDPNNSFKQAKKSVKHSYLLAIFYAANILVQILFVTLVWTLPETVSDAGWTALAVCYAIAALGVEVPEWFFLINMWVNIKYIEQHTKFNTKWFVIGLPILIGLSFIFSILTACIKTLNAILAFEIINIFITLGMTIIAAYGHLRIKTTLHQ